MHAFIVGIPWAVLAILDTFKHLLYGIANADEQLAPKRPPMISKLPIFPKHILHHIIADGGGTATEKLLIIPTICHSSGHIPCTVGHETGMVSAERCLIDRALFTGSELRPSDAAQSIYMFAIEKSSTT